MFEIQDSRLNKNLRHSTEPKVRIGVSKVKTLTVEI